nr:hypothetical protein Iba_scaffold2493CG0050 [Ipomoea batatas]
MMHLLRLFLQVDCVTLVATRVSKHSLRIGQRTLQNGLSTIFWLLFVLLSSEMQRDRGGELLMLGRGTPGSLEAGTTWSTEMIGTRGSTSEELCPTRLPNSAALKKTGGSGDTLRSVSAHRRQKARSGDWVTWPCTSSPWSRTLVGATAEKRGSFDEDDVDGKVLWMVVVTEAASFQAMKASGGACRRSGKFSKHKQEVELIFFKASYNLCKLSGVVAKYGSSSKIRLSFPDAILAKQEVVGDEISAVSR